MTRPLDSKAQLSIQTVGARDVLTGLRAAEGQAGGPSAVSCAVTPRLHTWPMLDVCACLLVISIYILELNVLSMVTLCQPALLSDLEK